MAENKTALISGSSRGIGFAVAQNLARQGYAVWINGRTATDVDHAVRAISDEGYEAHALVTDLAQEVKIEQAFETICSSGANLDVVVANIGSGKSQPSWQVSTEEYRRVFDLNFFSAVALCTKACEYMKAGGNIVAVSSIAGCESIGAPIAYSSAKAALIAFVKALSDQVAAKNIRVNCVSPGNVLFEGGSWHKKLEADPKGVQSFIETHVPLKRFAKPGEIAEAVNFLVHSSFATGANLVIDGGQTRGF